MPDVKNVFVFCASLRPARENFRKTVLNPVAEAEVLACFPASQHEELRPFSAADGFYLWGVKPSQRIGTMISSLEAGDVLLGFFHFHYRSFALLLGKAKSPELAKKLWGGEGWSEILFMSKPQEIEVPAKAL